MKTIAFYSYKGGLGRSLLVANLAHLLASCGRRVFVVDLDLEAPGLHYKLIGDNAGLRVEKGLLDFLSPSDVGEPPLIKDLVFELPSDRGHQIFLLPAGGALREEYSDRVGKLTGDEFFRKDAAGKPLYQQLKEQIQENYQPDYILLDARTGVTHIGRLSLQFLSDAAVCLFSCNEESYQGAAVVMKGIADQTAKRDPTTLQSRVYPIISRVIMSDSGRDQANAYARKLKSHIGSTNIADPLVLPADPTVEINDKLWTITGRSLSSSSLLSAYIEVALKIAERNDPAVIKHLRPLVRETIFQIDPAPEPIRARIDRRRNTRGLQGSGPFIVTSSTYVPGNNYQEFVGRMQASVCEAATGKPFDRANDVFERPGGSIRWDALPRLIRNGAIDFSSDPFFFSRTRQYLLGCLPIGKISTFTLGVVRGTKLDGALRRRHASTAKRPQADRTKNGWGFRATLRDLLETKVLAERQIGGWSDTTAMEECGRAMADLNIGTPPEELDDARAIIKWIKEDKEKLLVLDHGNAATVAKKATNEELVILYNKPHLRYSFHEQTLPVGFAYPKEDEDWGKLLASQLASLIEKGGIDEGFWNRVELDLNAVSIEALTFKELKTVAARGMPLSEAISWLDGLEAKTRVDVGGKQNKRARR